MQFGIVGTTFKKVLNILPPSFKRRFLGIQIMIIVSSFIDLLGLASFIPILSIIADPSKLEEGQFLGEVKGMFGVFSNDDFILLLFLTAVCFFVFRFVFLLGNTWIQNRFVFDLSEYIGVKTYRYYMSSNYEVFQKRESSKVIRELIVNHLQFARFLVTPLLLLSSEVLIVLIIVVGIAAYNFEVFLMLLITVFPVAFFFNKVLKKRMRSYGLEQNELTPLLYTQSSRGMAGFVDAKLRGKESSLINDYRTTLLKLVRINEITAVIAVAPSKLFELITVIGLFLLFLYSQFWAQDPTLMLPLLVLYAAAGYRIIPSLGRVIPSLMLLEQYQFLFKTFEEPLMSNETLVEVDQCNIEFKEQIEFKNLGFSYLGSLDQVLKGINLTIRKGEVIGLIGKSGSGKTTLVHLLAGFLKPSKGSIRIDGIPLGQEHMSSWMNKISYVQQSPYLEKGSLVSNIAFLDQDVNQDKIKYAIERSSLNEFVGTQDPNEILVSEQGKNLSGGQKQRVIIARALYHEAELILLDEATSALDNETEQAVAETIENLKGTGVTIVIIAHRYSTLKNADRIIELKNGVIEEGVSIDDKI